MKSPATHRVLFLPGMTGDGGYWKSVGDLLPVGWEKHYLSYPGLGTQPASPSVNGFDDLLALAESLLTGPTVVVAQSMGGILAIQLAHRHPERVTHLVLTATSGGVDVSAFGAADWRADFLETYPGTPRWAITEKPDLSPQLAKIQIPTLLLWADSDPISPVAVGRHLAALMPNARLHVFRSDTHSLAKELPQQVAAMIAAHIGADD